MITPRKPTDALLSFWRRLVCLAVLVSLCLGMSFQQVRAKAITVAPSGDTYVAYGRQNDNFSTKTTMWVGYDQSGGYLVERALLAFAPGALPLRGSTITSASLHLYLGATTTGDGSMVVSAHRITSNWDPTAVKWPSQPSFVPADTSTAVPAVVQQWYAWDVKTQLQTWSDQRDTTDFGLVLTSTATSGQHERSFRSVDYSGTEFDPYLEITYEPPPQLTISLRQTKLPGLKLQYDIAVTNPSKLKASSVKVVAPIPPGTTVQSAGGGTQVGSELQWTPDAGVAAGGAWNGSYTVAVTAAAGAGPLESGTVTGSVPVEIVTSGIADADRASATAILIGVNPAQQQVAAGGTATFEIAVTNMGTENLTQVAVADAEVPDCVRDIGALDAGKSYPTYTCKLANVQAGFTNTAEVTGNPPTGPKISDLDTGVVTVVHPSIQISKAPDTQQIFTGDTANFNITVTNNGDVALSGVAVSDPLAPGCNRNIGDLAKGAAPVSYPCTLANVRASFTNTATVTASSAVGALKPVDATAAVSVIVPPVNTGACVHWRYPGDTEDRIVCSNGTGGLPVFLPMLVR